METDNSMSVRVASFSCYLDTAKQNSVNRSVSSAQAQESPILAISPKTTNPPINHNSSHSKETGLEKNLRVDSFSYLNAAGENFVLKIPKNPVQQDPISAFSFIHEIPKKDSEISVFGADKYFNMKFECKQPLEKEWPINLPRVGSINGPRNPSLCSEASTLNSQTALILPNLQRFKSQTKQKRVLGRRIFGGFGCRGPCFESKDVHMNKIVAPYGSNLTRTGSERINNHHAAVLMPVPTVNKQIMKVENMEEESRKSIEVFGSASLTASKGDVAKNMERKLSVLTWDAIANGEINHPPSSILGSSTACDDMGSDASSDLFEIEHISGSLYPLLTAEATDDMIMSSCTSPQSNYAPSEASIQWSVVTASAADYSSILSDYNDVQPSASVAVNVIARNNGIRSSSETRNGGPKEAQKSRGAGLLGCKSYKAVDVVADNVGCNIEKRMK